MYILSLEIYLLMVIVFGVICNILSLLNQLIDIETEFKYSFFPFQLMFITYHNVWNMINTWSVKYVDMVADRAGNQGSNDVVHAQLVRNVTCDVWRNVHIT